MNTLERIENGLGIVHLTRGFVQYENGEPVDSYTVITVKPPTANDIIKSDMKIAVMVRSGDEAQSVLASSPTYQEMVLVHSLIVSVANADGAERARPTMADFRELSRKDVIKLNKAIAELEDELEKALVGNGLGSPT